MKILFSAIVILLAAQELSAQGPEQAGNVRSLAAAETAFAHESAAQGMRAAFLDALSDDGIVFQPGPQNGKKAWQAEKESAGKLEWQPVLAVVSASGDFGYTTGPWTFKKKSDDSEASAFGQFVSIWRREGGKWKLLFDLGSKNPQSIEESAPLQTVDLKSPNESNSGARAGLFQRDREYATSPGTNFAAVAAAEVRVICPQEFPAVGKAAAEALLSKAEPATSYAEAKGDVSTAGDLGFVWGEYTGSGSDGYYLRIWRKSETGAWQLALDLLHPR